MSASYPRGISVLYACGVLHDLSFGETHVGLFSCQSPRNLRTWFDAQPFDLFNSSCAAINSEDSAPDDLRPVRSFMIASRLDVAS